MGQKIQVQAVGVDDFGAAWRARRRWPAGQPVEVEVLDTDEDPPDLEGAAGTKVPDPARIGKKSYEQLKGDNRIRIFAAGELATSQSLEDLRSQVKTLQQQNDQLRAKVTELEGSGEDPRARRKG